MPPKVKKGTAKGTEVEKKTTWGSGGLFQNRSLGSLTLILLCPGVVMTFWYTIFKLDGSLEALFSAIMKEGPMFFYNIWPSPFNPLGTYILPVGIRSINSCSFLLHSYSSHFALSLLASFFSQPGRLLWATRYSN
jgi:hypothetical protein